MKEDEWRKRRVAVLHGIKSEKDNRGETNILISRPGSARKPAGEDRRLTNGDRNKESTKAPPGWELVKKTFQTGF